jgi:hypothetical protein
VSVHLDLTHCHVRSNCHTCCTFRRGIVEPGQVVRVTLTLKPVTSHPDRVPPPQAVAVWACSVNRGAVDLDAIWDSRHKVAVMVAKLSFIYNWRAEGRPGDTVEQMAAENGQNEGQGDHNIHGQNHWDEPIDGGQQFASGHVYNAHNAYGNQQVDCNQENAHARLIMMMTGLGQSRKWSGCQLG